MRGNSFSGSLPPDHDAGRPAGDSGCNGRAVGALLLTRDDEPDGGTTAVDSEWQEWAPRTTRRVAGPTGDLFPPGVEPGRRGLRGVVVALSVTAVLVAGVTGWVLSRGGSGAAAPADPVAAAVQRTVAARTAGVSLTMQIQAAGGPTLVANGSGAVDLVRGNSNVAVTFGPGRLAGEQVQEIFAGSTIYLWLPQFSGLVAGKPWVTEPLAPTAFVAPRNSDLVSTLGLLGSGRGHVVDLGSARVAGAAVHAYRVTVDPRGLAGSLVHAGLPAPVATAARDAAGTTPDVITVDVDAATGTVRRIAADVDLTVGSNPMVARMIATFGNAGRPVSVASPPADQVLTLTQLQAAVRAATPSVSA